MLGIFSLGYLPIFAKHMSCSCYALKNYPANVSKHGNMEHVETMATGVKI